MSSPDTREAALRQFVTGALRDTTFTLAPASADASFRRYFRIVPAVPAFGATSLITMDAPPPQEDCRPFVHVAKLLADAGLNAPRVLAQDLERGFLLLTDLGDTTYLAALDSRTAPALYRDATVALVRWQAASVPGVLPDYDETLLRREVELFPAWYLQRHLGFTPGPDDRAVLDTAFERILTNNLAQPRVYVHRDYHSRNLMVSAPDPGVLDFQDAVYGPITYDLVSLLRDAYVVWNEEQQIDWAVRYWERARSAGLPLTQDFGVFWRDFEWMGMQRQLKVLGIFARLFHRDGKSAYLADMPRVLAYLRAAVGRYDELGPLARLLDRVHEAGARATPDLR